MSDGRWSAAQAQAWADELPWLVGCNFVPSSAINQIEMFDAATFDPLAIERELGWAASIGINSVRVYLHDLLWNADPAGYKSRLDSFLAIAANNGIRALVVIFDDCWYEPVTGKQPDPVPGLHNSGWARSPGKAVLMNSGGWSVLENYVTDIVRHFADDRRILGWDVYNEVANYAMPYLSLPEGEREQALADLSFDRPAQKAASLALMEAAFDWVRAAKPVQPLTVGSWIADSPMNEQLYELSDIISFHHYRTPEELETLVQNLKVYGRPMWCTEYLNRREGAFFETHMPVFKREHIGCWNWGLVDGKTQTKHSWRDRPEPGVNEIADPAIWFHDIFRADGSAYREDELAYFQEMTARQG
jgi:Cellulase (glycosyl hydrolase family 5)